MICTGGRPTRGGGRPASGFGRGWPTAPRRPGTNRDTLQDAKDAHAAVHGTAGGRIQVYVGIEWLPLASPELLRDARALADELGTGIHIHLNESLTEVENSKERFGRRPTEVAYDAGVLGP